MKIYGYLLIILFQIVYGFIMATDAVNTSIAILIKVDQSGEGDYGKIQDAIDAVPSNNSELVFIWVESVTYCTVYYGEYKNYGPGANRAKRVRWSRSLSSDEVSPFLTKDMIGAEVGLGLCQPTSREPLP
ncbi:Pectinesterase domain-containing protein [Cephalotus follicularis]|uniref:pectinesterase n=1 Tax=Cephalotus follicularis TaxID=3775 RepID=A0A1Q3AR94_CEPFO|nr:Pectinesterase domain-containing protein [Cephalotus follicularis]